MADAKISISVNPTEFNLIRDTLQRRNDELSELSKLSNPARKDFSPSELCDLRQEHVQLTDILKKLR